MIFRFAKFIYLNKTCIAVNLQTCKHKFYKGWRFANKLIQLSPQHLLSPRFPILDGDAFWWCDQVPWDRVPRRPSAQVTECHCDRVPSDRVPNGHWVPSDPKSIQIKPKGGRKLLPPFWWSLKRKFGFKKDFKIGLV